MTWKCNSCGAVYDDPRPDGTPAFHVCPVDAITERALFDEQGNQQKPEKREALSDRRNENIRPELVYIEGKPMLKVTDPDDRTRRTLKQADSLIIAEGKGRTQVQETEQEAQP